MKRIHYIPLIVLLFLTMVSYAQNNAQGDVVVHSDPRLAVLLKRKHDDIQASSLKMTHKMSQPSARNAAAGSARSLENTAIRPGASLTAPAGNIPERPVRRWVPVHAGRVVYSGKGYRVQVYSGSDRNKAIDVKMACMSQFPGMRVYITYISPCFRVKVGDFRSRAAAESVLHDANEVHRPSMIVPDMVTVMSN